MHIKMGRSETNEGLSLSCASLTTRENQIRTDPRKKNGSGSVLDTGKQDSNSIHRYFSLKYYNSNSKGILMLSLIPDPDLRTFKKTVF